MKNAAGTAQLDLRFLQMDLQNLKSVKAAATSFSQREPHLDILINNAGVWHWDVSLSDVNTKLTFGVQIMGVPFELTVDGYELQWQVNYLAPYLFVSELLPLMLKTASMNQSKDRVRIVNVSSDMVTMLGPKHIISQDVNMTNQKGMQPLL
jgi:NAD(P)-dependent dehydrogenase (short-subunit alcohol dehydrogenase family)